MTKDSKKKQIIIKCAIIFLISILYTTLYSNNLYFDTHGWQDFEFIKDSSEISIKTMLSDFFFPGLDFLRGGHAQGVRTRIVEAFVLKTIHFVFGWTPFPYFFVKGIILSLLAVVLFLHLNHSTKSIFFSFIGTLFFLSLPPLFASFLFLYDFDVLAQLFIATVFLLFIHQLIPHKKYVAAMTILTLFALKTKASAIIIPAVIFLYLALFSRQKIKTYSIFLIIAFIFINPLYPLFKDKGNELGIFPAFDVSHLFNRLVLNKAWDYNADQTIPVIFSPKESVVRMPNTVSALFGFLFWWLAVTVLIIFLFLRRAHFSKLITSVKYNLQFTTTSNSYDRSLILYVIWFLTVLFFYQFDVSKSPAGTDMRYMTLAAIPLLLFVFTLLAYVHKEIQNKKLFFLKVCVKKVFLIFVTVAVFATILTNVAHTTVHLKGGYNARNHANINLFKVLYTDYYDETVDFYQFAQNNTFYQNKDNAIIQSTFTNYDFLDFGGTSFKLEEKKIDDFFKNKNNKKAYLVSLGKDVHFKSFKKTHLDIVDPCTTRMFEWVYCLSYQQKNNLPFVFYVSKIERK